MQEPRIPLDEARRLAALQALEILDTEAEERFDRITRLALRLFDVPIAVVSLVDTDREWFKSCPGLSAREGGRSVSFCGHTILGGDTFVINDAACDPRFASNPMVIGEAGIRFYAGHPIRSPDGYRVGALCIKDRRPRRLNEDKRALLRDLAAMVETEFHLNQICKLEAEIRRRTRAQRRAEEEREQFFNLSRDLLCIAGTDGYFKHLNRSWEQVLGYTVEELKSRPYVEFVHPADRLRTHVEAGRTCEGGKTIGFENRYSCKNSADGYRWLHWTATPVPERDLVYAVARDVTELKVMERDLLEAKRDAEAASRAKSEFLANMSHELRTPLNSVIGFSNLLLNTTRDELAPTQATFLLRVRDNGLHLLGLINEVLDIVRIEAGKMPIQLQTIRLEPLIRETLGQFEGLAAEAGITLTVDLPDPDVVLRTDPRRLRQVLINLVGNGVKFTGQGSVSVAVVAGGTPPAVQRIDVVDTGCGIPAAKRHRIFEAFHQVDTSTSRKFGGTGLGLTISRSLCALMGYRLSVESVEDEGSTFSIHIPHGPQGEPSSDEEHAERSPGRNVCIR